VTRPGPIVLAKMIGSARKAAGAHTAAAGGSGADAAGGCRVGDARLEWLNSPARDASASAVKTSIEKLTWFRNIDAHQLDLSMLPNERRRFLAQVARRSANEGLERRGDRLTGTNRARPGLNQALAAVRA
jgi:hypothetical protein